jgi:hypothetical protein
MRPWPSLNLAAQLVALSGSNDSLRAEGFSHAAFAHLLLGHWKRALAHFEAASTGDERAARNLAKLRGQWRRRSRRTCPFPRGC